MIVHLVYGCYEYEWQLDGIFSSKESAQDYIDSELKHGLKSDKDYYIEEHEVYD